MLQKSVEDFAENDIKFKELVKDAVREELKFYKQHISKINKSIFNINHINAIEQSLEDLQIDYKEYIEAMTEVLKKIENKLQNQRNDINVIAQYLRDLIKMEDKFQNQRNKVEILDIEGSSDGK
ncbi:hypothetical protein JF116_09170 [Campylobacter fetus subsp. venerealis]|uniref:hypothetical protein n=1 Tax=Campylobacter fetus TaxID=196 RepID=UPI00190DE0DA|nr:hypothetical protein [Campylobacter fetus]MBK3487550.1 hypothetical protein [Campylobacter fetus subsp. venerealis]